MSENNPYRIFVAHNWQKDDDYLRVFEYLEATDKFFYINLSDPEKVPDDVSKEGLKAALRDQAKDAEVVLLLSSLVRDHYDMAHYQVTMAKSAHIPIVGLRPWGSEEVSDELKACADAVAGWNAIEIVDAVKRAGRGEDANRWEVVEFDPNL